MTDPQFIVAKKKFKFKPGTLYNIKFNKGDDADILVLRNITSTSAYLTCIIFDRNNLGKFNYRAVFQDEQPNIIAKEIPFDYNFFRYGSEIK